MADNLDLNNPKSQTKGSNSIRRWTVLAVFVALVAILVVWIVYATGNNCEVEKSVSQPATEVAAPTK